jgi:hypothetical protein
LCLFLVINLGYIEVGWSFDWNHEMHEITREGIKETGLDPVGRAGGVFAGPLLNKLEDGSSKTPIHLLRKKTRFQIGGDIA